MANRELWAPEMLQIQREAGAIMQGEGGEEDEEDHFRTLHGRIGKDGTLVVRKRSNHRLTSLMVLSSL